MDRDIQKGSIREALRSSTRHTLHEPQLAVRITVQVGIAFQLHVIDTPVDPPDNAARLLVHRTNVITDI